MPNTIEAVTTAALSAALDVANRRQAVVSSNIANANTAGYVPQRLSFDVQLADARATLRDGKLLDAEGLGALRGVAETPPEADASATSVQLDVEMVELASNAAHFQALVQGISRHLSMLALAVADGRK